MALTPTEQIRLGIGDITIPFILTDVQIAHYLTSNSNSVTATIDELQPIIIAALASRGNSTRIGEIWEDNTKQSQNYIKAIEKANQLKAASAFPVIGGVSTESDALPLWVDMFDDENEDEESFYN